MMLRKRALSAAASRRWRQAHPEKARVVSAKNRKRIRGVNSLLVDVMKARPCRDCGGCFPACAMDWDHRPGEVKIATVADLTKSRKPSAVLSEISKCDLVCSNCHRVRTTERLCR